eukprot:CAMPEP_0182470688 /NCGR_PEP_ID=MMETSP1319-20130603/19094_1 /TAXON_ID=172717 /ORGANISM="Bolidomonas pacifica, Strain RCC208" /LENGTH=258 /DNA_ID=CAMNT_0024671159 /DNA_START=4 /DNA_END=780 /DNA_ORIENTATION=+
MPRNRRRTLKRSSSTSSLLVKSTLNVPNTDGLLLSMSVIIHQQIERTESMGDLRSNPAYATFNEDRYARMRHDTDADPPSVEDVFGFVSSVFELAEFSPECNVLALIFAHRLTTVAKVPLHTKNWRPIMLVSLLIAQKVWDDQSLSNQEFPVLWRAAVPFSDARLLNVEAINAFERQYLCLLGFNVSFDPSLFAKYYFELRSIWDASILSGEPLSHELATRFGIQTAMTERWVREPRKSVDDTSLVADRGAQSRAVLS